MMEQIDFLISIYPELWQGLLVSLELSAWALALGLCIGLPMSLAKTYSRGVLGFLATAYIEIIRGTPMVVQLFMIYYGIAEFGIVLDRMQAAILALAINSSAYQAEYFRGAIQSIDEGQTLAARAVGMSGPQTVFHIILPQALRIVIPPWSNELVYMVKYTSVVFLIAVPELMSRGQTIISRTFRPLETLFWVGVIYVIVLSILARLVDLLESRIRIPGFQMDREA